ncbi:prolipoprotein diacylglyceryl transferase [Thiomicrorhabdus sp. zzn3]|uniref:prolipoprotein diacylglyceryl transferase n=1 Tax=Thiomicrorhabdus sp. zzn3 TaxID=3039775 RepID=UPI00243729CD|nr:prolipoprotein diacylglyceryl transferase [Thiomicrorhabdus sp. zzn3]MDG6778499.1 prolipoprotein diacylglyceryl transferase [Thiomicrorhabdus sp. zzn3]
MWHYPQIDPVALDLGFFKIHWYGLMYLFAFLLGWAYGVYRARSRPPWNSERVGDLLFYIALGVILGGRLGYVLFYDLAVYLQDPMAIFQVWHGGMSFHGGLIGVTIAMWLYGRKIGLSLLQVSDFVAPLIPIGLLTGRIGNFINSELWGKVTDSPLGMAVYDPELQQVVTKYPTQLLEALLEGLVLFIILALFSRKARPAGSVAGVFLIGYGVFRFIVEFYRMPDVQLGYLAWGWLTMGQVLSAPMILIGAGLVIWSYRRAATASVAPHKA